MHRQQLTHKEMLELQNSPEEFIGKHPERILIEMCPDTKEISKEEKVYKMNKIVVQVR